MHKSCKQRIKAEWKSRKEDLQDPHYEALGFDYVEPNTFDKQPEGYWRWQFSWG